MGNGYFPKISTLRDVSRPLCVFKIEIVFFLKKAKFAVSSKKSKRAEICSNHGNKSALP